MSPKLFSSPVIALFDSCFFGDHYNVSFGPRNHLMPSSPAHQLSSTFNACFTTTERVPSVICQDLCLCTVCATLNPFPWHDRSLLFQLLQHQRSPQPSNLRPSQHCLLILHMVQRWQIGSPSSQSRLRVMRTRLQCACSCETQCSLE